MCVIAWLALLVQDVLLDSKQCDQLGQKIVLREQTLRLVSIERLEIFLRNVGLVLALLDVILFEHGVLDEISIRDIVQYGITEHFHLLVAGV